MPRRNRVPALRSLQAKNEHSTCAKDDPSAEA